MSEQFNQSDLNEKKIKETGETPLQAEYLQLSDAGQIRTPNAPTKPIPIELPIPLECRLPCLEVFENADCRTHPPMEYPEPRRKK